MYRDCFVSVVVDRGGCDVGGRPETSGEDDTRGEDVFQLMGEGRM